MAWKSVTCPNCNANLHVDEVNEFFFCNYCGAQIQRDPANSFTYRVVDVARIKEAESNERIKIKEIENKNEKEKRDDKFIAKFLIGDAIFLLILIMIMIISFAVINKNNVKEEERLQAIVTEIQQDVKNGDYDSAMIKANSLHSTRDKNSQEKWDKQREDLIKQIEQMKKERDIN